ncbi:MAG: peptidylprolyl isomerase [Anaerolineae bacterium]|nr:peptidylprolyl isomerase [Anaerolineae bacterium]
MTDAFRLLSVIFLLLLAACGAAPPDSTIPTNPASPPTAAPSPGELPTTEDGVAVVARVNGEAITLPEFERALARRQQEGFPAASMDALRQDVLNQLIEQTLIIQGAKAQNLVVDDAQLQAELQSQVELAGGQQGWESWLGTNLYTADEFSEVLRSVLTSNKVRDSLTTDLEGNVRQVHARHILLRTEAEAQAAMSRLQAGEDFAAVAMDLSQDETTRQSGGDLGWFTPEELLAPELAQVAFSLQPGQMGGPVASELGYHVVQTIEFADLPVEADRRVYIAQNRFENWLRPLFDNAVIERNI